eukprot:7195814-Pyramimonas_sp.AAC.1
MRRRPSRDGPQRGDGDRDGRRRRPRSPVPPDDAHDEGPRAPASPSPPTQWTRLAMSAGWREDRRRAF